MLSGIKRAAVRIPSPVIAAMPPPPPASPERDLAEQEEVDEGFMYLPLGSETAAPTSATPQLNDSEVHCSFSPDRHVFWPADAF
jgi:hypothetical protein